MELIISFLLGGLALLTIGVQRGYSHTSLKQIKKRARSGDEISKLLHRAVTYGPSLQVILWSLVIASHTLFFIYVSRSTEAWFAAGLCAAVLWLGFIWLPSRRVSNLAVWVAARLAPVFSKIASFLHPVVRVVHSKVAKLFPVHVHTGLYDQEDLQKLLQKQKNQPDNTIPDDSLTIAQHALSFSVQHVRDTLTPRRAVKMVHVDEQTTPVFIDELHKSGFSRFPVFADDQEKIVGVLYARDLLKSKKTKKISQLMSEEVLYIHEDQSLQELLQAMLKTHQHLFVVVNSFEEYVGVISIEDVLEQIIGKQIVDEFDIHEDMRAVAAQAAEQDHKKNNHPVED